MKSSQSTIYQESEFNHLSDLDASDLLEAEHLKLIKREAIVLALSIALLFACFSFVPLALKGTGQLIVLPIVLLALMRPWLGGLRVPRILLFLACLGGIFGLVAQKWNISLASGSFLVSTTGDKDLKQETKIYRDRLRRSVSFDDNSLVSAYSGVLNGTDSASAVLDRNPSLGGVIYGDSRWMSVALRRYDSLRLSTFPQGSIARQFIARLDGVDLYLPRSIPYVGLSHGQEGGTVYFLGVVIRSWGLIPKMLAPRVDSGEFEGLLEAASRAQVRWTSRAHLALPLWLSGTTHLIRAIEGSTIQEGELACAIDQLKEALSLFSYEDNPELDMVLRNSYALSLMFKAEGASDPERLKRQALGLLSQALRLRRFNPGIGSEIALNYLALEGVSVSEPYERKN